MPNSERETLKREEYLMKTPTVKQFPSIPTQEDFCCVDSQLNLVTLGEMEMIM